MKKILLIAGFYLAFVLSSSFSKTESDTPAANASVSLPAEIPAAITGNWMYGNFSMKEYWAQNPSAYLGNALQFAIAFKFNADSSYEQYFTSSNVIMGEVSYQQSVTKGIMEIDQSAKTIRTKAFSAHYKRTKNGKTEEERDLAKTELSGLTTYYYTTGAEPNGTKAIYLKLGQTGNPLTFLKK